MREFRRVVCEGVLIAAVGVGIAVFANSRNPEGLPLNRRPIVLAPSPPSTQPPTNTGTTRPVDPAKSQLRETVISLGFKTIDGPDAAQLFRDPKYQQGIYLFLDARNDDEYQAGHVPGAYHLYAFLNDDAAKQRFYEEFSPVSYGAEKIVVYCNGGHCDDSIAVAVELPQRGVDPAKVVVDLDGMKAWRAAGLPIERGTRGSGDIPEGKK
jgi:rhodanese-related sulfurtransferase